MHSCFNFMANCSIKSENKRLPYCYDKNSVIFISFR